MDLIEIRNCLETHQRQIHYLTATGETASMPFAGLAARSAELRQRLVAQGLGAGARVGLLSPNCIEWLMWDFALVELGCTVVGLPDELVHETGGQIFEIYDLSLVAVADDAPAAAVLRDHPHTADFHRFAQDPIRLRTPKGDRPFGVEGVVSLTFSSGVSGRPKCLMINAAGVDWDVKHYIPEYRPTPDDKLLIFLPLTHQQQRLLLYACYRIGTSFILIRPEQLFDAFGRTAPTLCLAPPLLYEGIHERFLAAVESLSPGRRAVFDGLRRFLNLIPGPLGRIGRKKLFAKVHDGLGGKMRLMITGMAPIKRATLDFFNEAGIALLEAYGLTETGVIAANMPGSVRPGAVGKPVKGSRIIIADDGEVLVERPHFAAHGYLDEEGRAQPFKVGEPVATGDIGRFDEDGFLFLLGRKKEIIVTSQGQKIHPERVETLFYEHQAISRCVVFGNDQKHLVALVSLRVPRTDEVVADIERHAAEVGPRLGAAFSVGRVVCTEDQFTVANGLLTRSLKINRRAIESRYSMALFDREVRRAEPLSDEQLRRLDPEVVRVVSAIWSEILGKQQIELTDNFFDLGGDSLCATRVVGRIDEQLGVRLRLEELMRFPTVYGTVTAVSAAQKALQAQAPAEAEAAFEEGSI